MAQANFSIISTSNETSTNNDIVPTTLVSTPAHSVKSSVFTSSEQDILFSHHLLKNHKAMDKEFHVDCGSNINVTFQQSIILLFLKKLKHKLTHLKHKT